MSLNTDALNEIYPNGLSDELQSHIERMQELSDRRGILSVTLLSNFGKDMEMSMKQETDIFRGLIVINLIRLQTL